MNTKEKSGPQTASRVRRNTLKTLAVGAGALAAPALMLKSAHGQSRTIKIGFVSPQTGPIAAFGEADKFVLDGVKAALAKGITVETLAGEGSGDLTVKKELFAELRVPSVLVDGDTATIDATTIRPVLPKTTSRAGWITALKGSSGSPGM